MICAQFRGGAPMIPGLLILSVLALVLGVFNLAFGRMSRGVKRVVDYIENGPALLGFPLLIVTLAVTLFSFLGMFVFAIGMVVAWNNSYWTHDVRTSDVIVFKEPTAAQKAFVDLPSTDTSGTFYRRNWVMVRRHGDKCDGNFIVGQVQSVTFSMDSTGQAHVIGRATRPDFRYLIRLDSPGCSTEYLVDRSDLAALKKASKNEAEFLATNGGLDSTATIRELNSVRPIR